MAAISSITLEVPDPVAAEAFYAAFGVGERLSVRASVEGAGSHRIAIVGDAGTFADPDGFAWEAARVRHENSETT